MAEERIRESVIAGTWYPGRPESLKSEISRYIDQAGTAHLAGELVGLVVPHAGYVYSGGVAAHAYKLLEEQPFDRVIILAPSHRAYFKGASVYTLGGYRTPFGVVPLDRPMVDALMEHPALVRFVPEADAEEHSLEIQLPFLQVLLRDFRLTPVVMGDQSFDFCEKLARVIADACRELRILLVASSDLSHFHPYAEANRLDQVVSECVERFDPEALHDHLQKGDCEACGAGPMLTVMLASRLLGANKARVLHYANSGDVSGDKRGVVGYLAAAFFRNPGSKQEKAVANERGKVGVDLGLSESEKQTLHEIATQAIHARCRGERLPPMQADSGKLAEPRGAFVCLHKGTELRGCIGMIEGREPLIDTVRNMAVQAAFSDPRFCAITEEELDDLHVEISVLTPFERIEDPELIEVGKHGIYIRKGHASGLLLPQVAVEHGWDRVQFLEWTCKKAGLPTNAWRRPETEIYLFSADVF
ncbi:MAG: AmmeMemoRadiSam system protein B [Syntrophobacteraceae bacterium]